LREEVEDHVAGDPMSTKKWVRKSLSSLADALNQSNYAVGRTTVRQLLRKLGYDLYHNRQSLTGPPHPDRDRQFRYINRVKKLFLKAGYPVISVDTKKKELIGNFKNDGVVWASQADSVNSSKMPVDEQSLMASMTWLTMKAMFM
jgi:hypothetical protein